MIINGSKLVRVTDEDIIDGCFEWPQGITKIEENAFARCSKLTHITLPKKIEKIGKGAFSECYNLIEITLSKNIEKIEENTFYDCSSLTTINFSDQITEIDRRAFYGCSNLIHLTLPECTRIIREKAFQGCINLYHIIFPEMFFIEKDAFSFCENLTQITFLNNINKIEFDAFSNCPRLNFIFTKEHNFDSIRKLVPQELQAKVFIKSKYLFELYLNSKEVLTSRGMINDVINSICYQSLSFFKPTLNDIAKKTEEVQSQINLKCS